MYSGTHYGSHTRRTSVCGHTTMCCALRCVVVLLYALQFLVALQYALWWSYYSHHGFRSGTTVRTAVLQIVVALRCSLRSLSFSFRLQAQLRRAYSSKRKKNKHSSHGSHISHGSHGSHGTHGSHGSPHGSRKNSLNNSPPGSRRSSFRNNHYVGGTASRSKRPSLVDRIRSVSSSHNTRK